MPSQWMMEALFVTALGTIGWFLRGLRSDVDNVKLDLAKNDVTHRQLKELRRDGRRTLAILTHLQIELARRLNLKPIEVPPEPFDDEGDDE